MSDQLWPGLDELRTRTSKKWRKYPPDVLPLFVAEMDVRLAEPVVSAVSAAMARGDTGYPWGTAYAEAVAGFAADRWAWDPPGDHTRIVPDVIAGMAEILGVITSPGDPVVLDDPVYQPFADLLHHLGRDAVRVPLTAGHRIDPTALETAFAGLAGRRTAYLLCNPHNPTGALPTRAELTELARIAAAHGVRVVADEIHAPLAGPSFVPYLTVPGTGSATALHSASKGWNLAGLKAAVAVAGGPDAAAALAALPDHVSAGASHVAVLAHTAAFTDGRSWLDELVAAVTGNRTLLAGLVAAYLPGVTYEPSAATYLAWLDCRGTDLGDDPAAAFLERGRVALEPGLRFGPAGTGFARLNLATSPEILTEAVHRMATALG